MRSQSKAILVGGLLVLLGYVLGSMSDQNRELRNAQVRRAEAEARLFNEQAATERRERAVRKQEWKEREMERDMQEKFGWVDDLKKQVDEQQRR